MAISLENSRARIQSLSSSHCPLLSPTSSTHMLRPVLSAVWENSINKDPALVWRSSHQKSPRAAQLPRPKKTGSGQRQRRRSMLQCQMHGFESVGREMHFRLNSTVREILRDKAKHIVMYSMRVNHPGDISDSGPCQSVLCNGSDSGC